MSDGGSDAMSLLEEAGAVLKGHFQYASGRHGDTYIEKISPAREAARHRGALSSTVRTLSPTKS